MTTQFEIIRPANTTAYAAGDVINNDSLTSMLETVHGAGYKTILGARIVSSNPTDTPDLSLYCFSNSFTIAADNSPFDPSDVLNKSGYLGRIKFASSDWAAFPSNKACDGKPLFPFDVLDGSIYCVLVADAAYTPASAEIFTLTLSDTL